MPLTDPVELLAPSPVHLLLLLIVLALLAFRAGRGSFLRRWRFILLAAVAWCWLAATPAFAHWMGRVLEAQYAPLAAGASLPENPVILVLAGGDSFEPSLPDRLQLNLAGYRRTAEGARLWHLAGGTLLLVGTTAGDGPPEAERMATLAENLGVARASIRTETASRNTWQNLRNAVPLIAPERPVILVTSALHMPRAMGVARQLGLAPLAAPADFRARSDLAWHAWLPNSQSLGLFRLVLHEWTGRAYYALRGWS